MIILVGILFALALGGAAFAFTGGDEKTQKRVAAVAKPEGKARGRTMTAAQENAQKRKNVAAMLKDVEKNRAAKKEKPTMRRRLEQAGFPKTSPRSFRKSPCSFTWASTSCTGASIFRDRSMQDPRRNPKGSRL